LVEEFGGLKSPLFQLVKIALNAFWVTHGRRVTEASPVVTILYDIQ
jgi:hypothetical protein